MNLQQGRASAVVRSSELNEEALKALQMQYADWIEHPTTQQLVNLLNKRIKYYDDILISHIRTKSDKEFEDKQRSAISTCQAVLKLVTDRDEFIKHSTKRD